MQPKKVHLEQLFEEIRALSENFQTDEGDSDIFILNPNELVAFSEELLSTTKSFIKNEISVEDLDDEDEDDDDLFDSDGTDDDFLFNDYYDDEDLD
jgi:hypothetical protein